MDKTRFAIFAKLEIKHTLLNHQDSLRKYGVKWLGLFGSHVKVATHEDSDNDMFVEFAQPFFHDFMGYLLSLKVCLRKRLTW